MAAFPQSSVSRAYTRGQPSSALCRCHTWPGGDAQNQARAVSAVRRDVTRYVPLLFTYMFGGVWRARPRLPSFLLPGIMCRPHIHHRVHGRGVNATSRRACRIAPLAPSGNPADLVAERRFIPLLGGVAADPRLGLVLGFRPAGAIRVLRRRAGLILLRYLGI